MCICPFFRFQFAVFTTQITLMYPLQKIRHLINEHVRDTFMPGDVQNPTCVCVPGIDKAVLTAGKDEGSTRSDAATQLLPEVHCPYVLLHHTLSATYRMMIL